MYIGKTISYPAFVDIGGITESTNLQNTFRYTLTIPFKGAVNTENLVVIMKNPSSASSLACDMTILKVCNVAHNSGYGGVTVANLFPIRATNAVELQLFYASADYGRIMADNLENIKVLCTGKDVVFAWGSDSIGGRKQFPQNYDNAIKNTDEAVKTVCRAAYFAGSCKCKGNVCTADNKQNCPVNICYPLHGLRWSFDSKLIKY